MYTGGMKRRWIRVLVVAGWVVIVGMLLVGQWRFLEVYGHRVGMMCQSEGVAVGWIPSHFGGAWHVLTAKNARVARDYVVPRFERWGSEGMVHVPWMWVVAGFGGVTWGLWRR